MVLTEAELLAKRLDRNRRTRELATDPSAYPLTTNDERLILLYYHQKINDLCKYFKFPLTTSLSAHFLFARLFTDKPLVDTRHDLKHVMLATLYLASKVDEQHTVLSEFCKRIPGTERRAVEELEFVILEWLDYDVWVECPLAILLSFIVDIYHDSADIVNEVYSQTVPLLTAMFMTDIPLVYDTVIISLAVLKQTAVKRKQEPIVDDYIQRLSLRLGTDTITGLVQSALTLSSMQATTLDARYLKEIDGKLTSFRANLNSK